MDNFENLDRILRPSSWGEENSNIINSRLPSIGLPQFLEYFNLFNEYFKEEERLELLDLFSKYQVYDGELSERDFGIENFYLKSIFYNIPPKIVVEPKNIIKVKSFYKYKNGFSDFLEIYKALLLSRRLSTTLDYLNPKYLRGRPLEIFNEIEGFFQRFDKSISKFSIESKIIEDDSGNKNPIFGKSLDSKIVVDLNKFNVVEF